MIKLQNEVFPYSIGAQLVKRSKPFALNFPFIAQWIITKKLYYINLLTFWKVPKVMMIIETRLNLTMYASGAKKIYAFPQNCKQVFQFLTTMGCSKLWKAYTNCPMCSSSQKQRTELHESQPKAWTTPPKSSDTIIRIGIGLTLDRVILEVKKWH